MKVAHMPSIKYVVDQDGRLRAFNTEKEKFTRAFKGVKYHTQLNKELHLISFS